jgi:hypothetical protein
MNLLEYSHIIKMSGKVSQDNIMIKRIEAEKIIMLLSSPNKPQFILVNGSLLNTSYIIGIIETPSLSFKYTPETRELTSEEKLLHDQFIKKNDTKLLK